MILHVLGIRGNSYKVLSTFASVASCESPQLIDSNVQLNRNHAGYFLNEYMSEKITLDIVLPWILLHGGEILYASPLPPVEFMASVFVHSEAWMIESSVRMIGLCRFSQ